MRHTINKARSAEFKARITSFVAPRFAGVNERGVVGTLESPRIRSEPVIAAIVVPSDSRLRGYIFRSYFLQSPDVTLDFLPALKLSRSRDDYPALASLVRGSLRRPSMPKVFFSRFVWACLKLIFISLKNYTHPALFHFSETTFFVIKNDFS